MALVVGHRDEELALFGLADLVDGADVFVVERGGRLSFPDEARVGLVVGAQVRRQKLQRDGAVELRVAGFVDHAHAPATEFLQDLVVGDGSANEFEFVPVSGIHDVPSDQ